METFTTDKKGEYSMVEVSARVDDDYMTLHFPSIEDAINYVSFEYEYYSKLHVDTERFNVADTQDAPPINICEDVLDRDPHCEQERIRRQDP